MQLRLTDSIFFRGILTLTAFIFSIYVSAADIRGRVYDRNSREQLIEATVTLEPGTKKTITALDGGFSFRNLAAGRYSVRVSYIGYADMDTTFELEANSDIKLALYLQPQGKALADVIISSSGDRSSDQYALRREQYANNIENIVSAHSIALSPDITVANVMQRISGVSIERSHNGEGQFVIIRGMDKRYNTTLINGVKVPSPDNRNRYVPLDIFPADLVERIEVIKSLTPDQEGDAAGGVVNLVMKNAPNKFTLEGSLATGYSQIFLNRDFRSYSKAGIQKQSPAEKLGAGVYASVNDFPSDNLVTTTKKPPVNKNFSLTVGNRFLKQKLGVIFSGSYQNSFKGSNANILQQSLTVPAAPDANTAQQPAFSDVLVRQYSSRVDRAGVEAKVDYELNTNNSISLFATYLQLNEHRTRFETDTLLGGYTTPNNFIGPYAITTNTETRSDLQNIYNVTLQGKHRFTDLLSADWSAVASAARRQLPDIAEFSIGQAVNPNTSAGTYTITDPITKDESREWIHNKDKDLAGYLNLHYHPTIAGKTAQFSVGGLYRRKDRSNYANTYHLTPINDPNEVSQAFVSIPDSKFTFIPANAALGNAAQNPGIYTAYEDVASGYLQGKYAFTDRFEALVGARVEHTHQNYVSSLNPALPGKTADINYTDILSSVQAKYSLTRASAVRLSYFRSIYRPAFADLIPFPDKSGSNDTYLTQGNPYIKHTVIDNIDARYELFPHGLDQFMIGVFYKIIADPIEYAFARESGSYGATPVLAPQNFGTAYNYGAELVFRKYFGDFGVSGNYTFTHSTINASKLYVYLTPDGTTHYETVADKRPLQGQSAHIANFSLLYKNTKQKIDLQIAGVYTGPRINTLSQYKGFDNWQRGTVTLDVPGQKGIGEHLIIFAKANNLLNPPFRLIVKQYNHAYNSKTQLPFQNNQQYITVEYDKYYASYLLGLRFKFSKK